MKRQFFCVMILALFLFGTSQKVEASAIGKVAIEVMSESGEAIASQSMLNMAKKFGISATDDIMKAMTRAVKEASGNVLGKFGQEAEEAALKAATAKLGSNASKEAIQDLSQQMLKETMEKAAREAAEQTATNIARSAKVINSSLLDIGTMAKNAGMSVDNIVTKFGKGTVDEFDEVLNKLPNMKPAVKQQLQQEFKYSNSILGKTEFAAERGVSAVSNKFNTMLGKSEEALFGASSKLTKQEQVYYTNARQVLGKATTREEFEMATRIINNLEYKVATNGGKVLRRLGGVVEHAMPILGYAGMTISAAVLFMVPSTLQAAFMAQQQKNVMLQTYIPPIKFGNIVMQLPDSVINMDNSSMSQFVYYGIPVDNPGDKLSAAAQAAYPGISGPTESNKVSSRVSNEYARLLSGGDQHKIHIRRYNLGAQALAKLPIFVSYTDQNWPEWSERGIPDPTFSQVMLNLNTGHIFYGDGTSQGSATVPLLGDGRNGKTIQSFLKTKYGFLTNAGAQVTYREYADAYSGAKAGNVDSVIANQFNCACLAQNNGVISEDTLNKCSSSKNSTCLLTKVLNDLSAGLAINAEGKALRPDQDLAAEVAKGALGQVVPIQGLGNKFGDILRLFPGAEQDAIANSGVLTINLDDDASSARPVEIQGADPDNYTAKGIYVYQCKNTPLAKILKSQSGGAKTASYNEQITDYIIFLDGDLNQVPLMTPAQDPKNYNFISMGLNPAIKYVSTIIGNLDEAGNFSFLPQLNIPASQSQIKLGVPASFAPLYGLQVKSGSLSKNYNPNLSSVIGGAAQSLMNNPKLGQQFKHMQSVMVKLLFAGPFGKYKLNPVDASMQPSIGGVSLALYTGFNGYPVPQDKAHSNCSDILIPISAQGKTVTLPSNNVAQYYGLVTDITYSVRPDGTIAVDPSGFANSPFSLPWTINQSKLSQFYWIEKLTAMGQSNDPDFVMPDVLMESVMQARMAWVSWIQSTSPNQEYVGVKVPGTSTMLTIASQQALDNGLFLYTCSPSPSTVAQDYFVLTNSLAPQVSDAGLGSMSATTATAATNMLSVVSGLLYNVSGVQIKNSAGVGYSINATDLLKALNRTKPKGFSNDLKAKLNISSSQSSSAGQSLVYPFEFGGLQLGIYQADLNTKTYLYVDAAGAGSSEDFQSSDYFVTLDSYQNPKIVGQKLSSEINFMVSLVSGNVYGREGVLAIMEKNQLAKVVGLQSSAWQPGVKNRIELLTANFAMEQKDQQQETDKMNAQAEQSNSVTLDRNTVTRIIAGLASQNYLPIPYDMLKQDAASGMYILIAPANAAGTEFLYVFFDVPNNFTDANGKPVRVGAMYDGQGNLLNTLQGLSLATMLQQYGVVIDSAGKQSLGLNSSLPMMQLDPADLALKPGVSGKSMIHSNDPQFPSHSIVSPLVYQDSQFHFYYNTITQGYYAMEVKGSSISYIDMVGAGVYNLNGTPKSVSNPVAINSNGDVSDILLPYLNINNFMRCIMKNPKNNNIYSDFINSEPDFQPYFSDPATHNSSGLNVLYSLDATATNVNVSQMPFPDNLTDMPDITVANQYNVYWDNAGATTYNVDKAYRWQDLQLLPIDMNRGVILNPLPEENYNRARLVFKNNIVNSLVFADQFYTGAVSAGKNSYSLTAGSNKVTISLKTDAKVKINYIEIIAGSKTYNYQFMYKTISDTQFQNYQNNVWQVKIIADVTGRVLLEKYLPIDSSGNVKLLPVGMQSVVELPADTAVKSLLSRNLGNIMQDDSSNRFLASIDASTYPYFKQSGYVDLESGTIFDSAGIVVGFTLSIVDLMDLLNKVTVTVVRNKENKAALRYRAPMVSIASQVEVGSSPAAPAATRSTLLGRISSKIFKKKKNK